MDKYFTYRHVIQLLHTYCITQEYSNEAISSLYNTDRHLFNCFYSDVSMVPPDAKMMFGVTTIPEFNLPDDENIDETETW